MTIKWLGLQFTDNEDLQRARLDLQQSLDRITTAENDAWKATLSPFVRRF